MNALAVHVPCNFTHTVHASLADAAVARTVLEEGTDAVFLVFFFGKNASFTVVSYEWGHASAIVANITRGR